MTELNKMTQVAVKRFRQSSTMPSGCSNISFCSPCQPNVFPAYERYFSRRASGFCSSCVWPTTLCRILLLIILLFVVKRVGFKSCMQQMCMSSPDVANLVNSKRVCCHCFWLLPLQQLVIYLIKNRLSIKI